MTPLDGFLRLGETIVLGSHTFTAEEIKTFAGAFDPQPFHLDEEKARDSVFGGLCASGWHVTAMWMRYNILHSQAHPHPAWTGQGAAPEFGPSPGFRNLKWMKPARPGDTLTFTRKAVAHRPLASRPGWNILSTECGALDDGGKPVMIYEGSVLFRTS